MWGNRAPHSVGHRVCVCVCLCVCVRVWGGGGGGYFTWVAGRPCFSVLATVTTAGVVDGGLTEHRGDKLVRERVRFSRGGGGGGQQQDCKVETLGAGA